MAFYSHILVLLSHTNFFRIDLFSKDSCECKKKIMGPQLLFQKEGIFQVMTKNTFFVLESLLIVRFDEVETHYPSLTLKLPANANTQLF